MKQKILSGILAGVMAFTVMPMAVSAANKDTKITFSDATYAEVGDEIKITVSIENNPGFVSATIPVQWDKTKLVLKSIDKTDMIEELLADGVTPSGIETCGWIGYEITDAVKKSGLYHLAWNYDTMHDGSYNELEFTENGDLCVMVFEVIADSKEDIVISADIANAFTNVMDFEMKDLVKHEDTDVTIVFGESKITLTEPPEQTVLRGDVNGDGKVNSDDAVVILQKLVGLPVEKYIEAAADYNGDGKSNSDDAVAILQWLVFGK